MRPFLLALFLFTAVFSMAEQKPDSTGKPATDTPARQADSPAVKKPANTAAADSAKPQIDTAVAQSVTASEDAQKADLPGLYKNKFDHIGWSAVIAFLIVAGLGFWLLGTTALCKDLSYDPRTNQLRPVDERPYSYSKVQLFWWTIIILSCFLTFYFYTGKLLAFTQTVIILLGGGLAVAVFGKAMDNTQIKENDGGVPTRHQDTEGTQGFLTDILSDEGGISIHRFQAVIFNLVFGMAFLASFFKLATAKPPQFPFIDFEMWQLTLLGVSSAAYLGFKSNENTPGTKLKRQIEAVTSNKSAPAAKGAVILEGAPVNQPQAETPAFRQLKAELVQRGIVNPSALAPETLETPVVRDVNNF
ncbi:MAG TPA: hypothetical protein VEB42_07055 [Chitinophagaceae bacterium]|nr:hypothetical protein [Chitinophagaceae bacterium]